MEIIYNPIYRGKIVKIVIEDANLIILSGEEALPFTSAINHSGDGFQYEATLPLNAEIKQIVEEIKQINFGEIMNSVPERNAYFRKNSELAISDENGLFHYDFIITNPETNDNPEVKKLHSFMQSLFTEIEISDWYDYRNFKR